MRKTWRMVKVPLPFGCRWLTAGEKMKSGDIGFDGGVHTITLPYIVGKRWNRREWNPIARKIDTEVAHD
jgi:hypothetical protein